MDFIAYAPGRVNLIGEHTDYTGGLSLPFAIQMGVTINGTRNDFASLDSGSLDSGSLDSRTVRATSDAADGTVSFDIGADYPDGSPSWGQMIAAVATELGVYELGPVGANLRVTSTLPVGSGLSSSAAFCVATTLALCDSPSELSSSGVALARIAQLAETSATDVPCGIMDQVASAYGSKGHALLLDSRTTSYDRVPLPRDWRYLVVHSGQQRTLAGSEYGLRAAQCAAAESQIGPLREATEDDLKLISDPVVRGRARHVIRENARVLSFVEATEAADIDTAGALISESHASLAGDFEVSTDALDSLVASLTSQGEVAGARLLGGGFGGCVIALCREGATVPAGYEGWFVEPSDGAAFDVVTVAN